MTTDGGMPLVFDIRRFSLNDGPGIRTTVFLKGCPLSCIWCHNPESMNAEAEMFYYPSLCVRCGECLAVCPEGAILAPPSYGIDRDLCTACGKCADICPSGALKTVGKYYSPDALVEELLKDMTLYKTSGGGVTFSGGESGLFTVYTGEVMRALKEYGIPVAIQTSGMFDLAGFRERMLPHIDLIYFDLKIFDSWKHREYTGEGNRRIWDNFLELASDRSADMIPRMPLVPGITADRKNLSGIAGLLKEAGCDKYELLSYHTGGIAKRCALGKAVPHCLPEAIMGPEEEQGWKAFFAGKMEGGMSAFNSRPEGSVLWLYQ